MSDEPTQDPTDDFEGFEEDGPRITDEAAFRVDLEGYEGPIDLLLDLAGKQKVDLRSISMVALAEQYLAFIQEAKSLRLEIAADYLVMAAWLAYMKSRLLLPQSEEEDEPSGAILAAVLRFQLQRLQAMQQAAEELKARPRLGEAFFARGGPSAIAIERSVQYEATLYDLLKAYARNKVRAEATAFRVVPMDLYSVDDALQRLRGLLGKMPGWRSLAVFLPDDLRDELHRRSALAATFAASLEMVRDGHLKIRQEGHFGPIFLRSVDDDGVRDEH